MANPSLVDTLVLGVDRVLKTLARAPRAERPSPGREVEEVSLSETDTRHAAGLMRVNHTGEICAQALYEGQALVARDGRVKAALLDAAREEEDHLAWCDERLGQLDSKPSVLNPVWYGLSYALGTATGLMGDKISLGFVAATEDQVCRHLESHLEELPMDDARSRVIVEQMHADEARHGTDARRAGGVEFPAPVKDIMSLISKLMTTTSYRG
jgi:ubiquinone biosynthesis monooxygenase Coq7